MSAMAQNQEVWGDSTFSGLKYNNYKLFGQLRNMADYINYRWQKDIVGYDTEDQEQLLLKFLGDRSVWKRIAIMFGGLIVIASLLALWTILKGRKSFHPADKVIVRLSKKLSQRGLAREQGEGVIAYLQRLEQQQPHWQVVLKQLQTQYSIVRYQQPSHDNSVQVIGQMRRLLRNWPNYQAQKTKEI
ncbi:MAG: hypothetical protein IPG70_08200 [Moraxellaceae bacterium]|nr:hypothetical protein [Moraxellaceae bacterium]